MQKYYSEQKKIPVEKVEENFIEADIFQPSGFTKELKSSQPISHDELLKTYNSIEKVDLVTATQIKSQD